MSDYLDEIARASQERPKVSESFFRRFLPLFFENLSEEEHGTYLNEWLNAVKSPAIRIDVVDDQNAENVLFSLPPLTPPRNPDESRNMVSRLAVWRLAQQQTHLHGRRHAELHLKDLLEPPEVDEAITAEWRTIYQRYVVGNGSVKDDGKIEDVLDFDSADDEW